MRQVQPYQPSHIGEDARKCMNDLDYRSKAVDQLLIFVAIIFESGLSFLK